MAEFSYEIIRKIGVISEENRGWTKELNLISWNKRDPKYDLRDWNHEEGKMGKGITITKEELKELLQLLKDNELDL